MFCIFYFIICSHSVFACWNFEEICKRKWLKDRETERGKGRENQLVWNKNLVIWWYKFYFYRLFLSLSLSRFYFFSIYVCVLSSLLCYFITRRPTTTQLLAASLQLQTKWNSWCRATSQFSIFLVSLPIASFSPVFLGWWCNIIICISFYAHVFSFVLQINFAKRTINSLFSVLVWAFLSLYQNNICFQVLVFWNLVFYISQDKNDDEANCYESQNAHEIFKEMQDAVDQVGFYWHEIIWPCLI